MKKISMFLLAIVLLSFCTTTVYGADASTLSTFNGGLYVINGGQITISDGTAFVNFNYYENESTFSEARFEVKIQKRFLGIFWTTVDIGLPDNTWSGVSYQYADSFNNSFTIDSTGTYRAVIDLDIYKTDGSVEHTQEKPECVYS